MAIFSITTVGIVTVTLLLLNIIGTLLNYRKARKIGLPTLFTPIDAGNVFWIIFSPWLEPVLRKLLPFGLSNFVEYNSRDWNFANMHSLHAKVGDAFTIVSPERIRIVISNAKAIDEITRRRRDFPKAISLYKPLELFGKNLVTTEGQEWVLHRKLTTSVFNERNNKLVWNETRRQAEDMLQTWSDSPDGITNPGRDSMLLALHVLTGAGLGRSYKFEDGLQTPASGHSLTYSDALSIVLTNLFTAIFSASIKIPMWLLPAKIKQTHHAVENFKRYMSEMVQGERDAMASGRPEGDHFMSILVRASDAEKMPGSSARPLTDSEIHGNLFTFNLAGHDTTASTIAYAVILLSTHPEWQEWVAQEVERVGSTLDSHNFDYDVIYPQMNRCMALMNETLRVYGPARLFPKTTTLQQDVMINEKHYTIPAKTIVVMNIQGSHTNPVHWGSDVLKWNPGRWISTTGGKEELISVPAGSFIPFASGARICPGRKFSQVEFVAMMFFLLRSYRVEPMLEDGESLPSAASRIMAEMDDSSYNFLLKMKHPERVKLKLVARKTPNV